MSNTIDYKSPRDRYYQDLEFHLLVDTLLYQIIQARFTPSELRQAAILASIKYEETHVSSRTVMRDFTVVEWLDKGGY